jgi:ferritin-like metal-binding protein YciE
MKLESLRELFIEELQDLYSAENQILEALPKMIEKASSPDLKAGFTEHLEQTRQHVSRLDRIFDQLGDDVDADEKTCKGMQGIIKDAKELLKTDAQPEVLDAGMIAGAQRVEHYEIAGYGTVRTYAQLLGRTEWAQLLEQTLQEEKETDKKLSQLASHINLEAKAA